VQPAVHRLHFRLYAEIADRTFSLFRHLCCTRYGTYSHKPWLKKFGPFGGLRAQAGVGIESCKIMFLGGTYYSLVQTLLLWDVCYRLATMHSITDRQTDGIMMPVTHRKAWSMIG